jgi:hypothetical protein
MNPRKRFIIDSGREHATDDNQMKKRWIIAGCAAAIVIIAYIKPTEAESLMKYVPDAKNFVIENERSMSEVLNVLRSKKGKYSLSIYHILDDDIDKIIVNVQTMSHANKQDVLDDASIFSINEKILLRELFLRSTGRVSLQYVSSGHFILASENLASIRVKYLGDDQETINSLKTDPHTYYFEEIQDGWYIMIIASRGG